LQRDKAIMAVVAVKPRENSVDDLLLAKTAPRASSSKLVLLSAIKKTPKALRALLSP
jgi:hypothetical protein